MKNLNILHCINDEISLKLVHLNIDHEQIIDYILFIQQMLY